RAHDVASDDSVLRFGEAERKGRRDEPDLSYIDETGEACSRFAKIVNTRMDARALESAADPVVIGWSELTREQENRLVSEVGEVERLRPARRMARAQASERG